MTEEQFNDLLAKYRDGRCTDMEKTLLENWLISGRFDIQEPSDQQIEAGLNRLNKRLGIASTTVKLWPRFIAAASVVVAIGAGIFFYSRRSDADSRLTIVANDLGPGKQGATLTLSNGKRIKLSEAHNGQLAQEAGVLITKADNGELTYQIETDSPESAEPNVLATANGETYRVRLPDGSMVWLNASSSITYTTNLLEAGKRKVTLDGEAFFDIRKDKDHPFVVYSRGQQVEVLGTQFNINSYRNEQVVATTLLEGAVRINSGGRDIVVRPGEQTQNEGGYIHVEKVDVEKFVDWKEGDFNLDNLNFKVAMRKIARWYDLEVIFDKSIPEDMRTGGWISRNKKLSEVLNFIASSGIARFRLEGKKLYVSR